jgi:hypothetical protein
MCVKPHRRLSAPRYHALRHRWLPWATAFAAAAPLPSRTAATLRHVRIGWSFRRANSSRQRLDKYMAGRSITGFGGHTRLIHQIEHPAMLRR